MSCIWYLLKEKGKKNGFSITSALFQRETKPASSHVFLKYCLSFLSSTCALPPSIFHIHCGLPGLSASSEVMTESWGFTQAILAEPKYQENTPVSPSTQHTDSLTSVGMSTSIDAMPWNTRGSVLTKPVWVSAVDELPQHVCWQQTKQRPSTFTASWATTVLLLLRLVALCHRGVRNVGLEAAQEVSSPALHLRCNH